MFLLLLALIQTLTAHADEAVCFATAQTCADLDIDQPRAEEAYRKGCGAKDFYACARLGQFFEVKKADLAQAVSFYDQACAGKDSFGCDQADDLHQRLCFLEDQKKFCDKRKPTGEYAIYLFLKTFDPKFAGSFSGHHFHLDWVHPEVGKLYEQRVKEKSAKLLRALTNEERRYKHDGADGEELHYQIDCVKRGKCLTTDFSEENGAQPYKGKSGKHR